jgi:ribulose-phosphate 3-epimerase
MVFDIENKINKWLESPVKRVIFHLETAKDPYLLVEKCKKAGKEAGIAISPKTDWSVLAPFCGKADMFQILAVVPGLSGQKFNEECLEKISRLRQNCPNCIIEVDGGVTYEVAKKVAKAGADIVASASAIFNEKNIGEAIEKFKKIQ